MARTIRNAKIDTRSARIKLASRREPYWVVISKGRALGYRKGAASGTWIAKYIGPDSKRIINKLGAADDAIDSGPLVLDFATAQERARDWFLEKDRAITGTGPYTVNAACADYLKYVKKYGESYDETKRRIDVFILPEFKGVEVVNLTQQKIETWHEDLAATPARLRTRKGNAQRFKPLDSEDARRRRKSTVNRHLTTLKAILNRAYNDSGIGAVQSDYAWRSVRPFKGVDAPKVRYLTEPETTRLINSCDGALRILVTAAILTGCRYGELTRLKARDFDAIAVKLYIEKSKSGKARHIALTNEGAAFFQRLATGKAGDDLMLLNHSGDQWGKSQQRQPLIDACKTAKIDPPISFHVLRHTYASRLLMRGVALVVIAAQLGHSDTRMVDRHYGHLAPDHIADKVREAFGTLGLDTDNVAAFKAGGM